ncbi:MAG: lipoate--protein ligase family protein [Planctomycetes bacterium]|nr:lipoate--protein ligase family protein [Planctomycetota bacterium]
MTANVRLIIDPPGEGAWNMAVDEALLESTAAGGGAALRLYQWRPATLSLGYFQCYAERESHPPSLARPIVRRPSGGGAILHHHELTYSFTALVEDRVSARVQALYRSFHGALVKTLTRFGAKAELWSACRSPPPSQPFLCFQRRGEGDVILGGHKVCGSAQRRRRQAVLQHGSILLRRSEFAPELPGIAEIIQRDVATEEFASCWRTELQEMLEARFVEGELTDAERGQASDVLMRRHATRRWLRKC